MEQTTETTNETETRKESATKNPLNETETKRVVTERPVMDPNGYYEYVTKTWLTSPENLDKEILYKNTGNAAGNFRFADQNAFIIYKFDLQDKYEPVIGVRISNTFLIEVSSDAKNWKKVYDWTDEHDDCHDRSNDRTFEFNPFDFEVYNDCYVRFSDAVPSDGWGSCFTSISFGFYADGNGTADIFNMSEEVLDMVYDLADYSYASDVNGYKLASDGGLIYTPISNEKASSLHKYDNAPMATGETKLTYAGKEVTLKYWIPQNVTAYDVVPVKYEISTPQKISPAIHLSATAFEDANKEGDNLYYDLNLPGTVSVKWDYLGYVNGTYKLSNRPVLATDIDKTVEGKQYPQYNTTDLICSGTVPSADITWFKFKYTNDGDTILDGDGNGTFCFEAVLYRKNGTSWTKAATLENLYSRILEEVYPGESGDMYFTFNGASNLAAGDYRIEINSIVRNETTEGYGRTIWGGETYSKSTFDFKVAGSAEQTTPNEVQRTTAKAPTRNTWLHTYEEFMSSFESMLKGIGTKTNGTIYLQVAPWTNQIVLKMIVGNNKTMTGVKVPVTVDTASLKINLNPECNAYVVKEDGTRFPAITVQSMADMRGNVQLGPDAAGNVIGNLVRFKNCGINVMNTTAAFEFDASFGKFAQNNIDACWFSLDVARILGLKLQGWLSYPYNNSGNLSQASLISKTSLSESVYGSEDLAKANAINAIWQYQRWGENYWIAGNDTIPLDVEDTRGWMRVDFNAREKLSETEKTRFRAFLKTYYGTIDELNADWETDYKSFSEIDPEAGTTDDHGWSSYKSDFVFGEWSLPLSLLDSYRTLERVNDYKMVLKELSEVLPTAKIVMRTEGANWVSIVDPDTTNPHLRHVYYSQRRCGIVPELLCQANVLYAAADYTTLPYTPSEVAELTKSSVNQGVVPMLLPQFNRMRDIAINSRYGTDFTYEYNLEGTDVRGAYINTVVSVYEWFKATYENGGVPGLLAQDYLCDGYMTSTQYKEIAFFTEKLTEAVNTPEGQTWAKNFTQNTNVLDGSSGVYSYNKDHVQSLVDAYLNKQ